MSYKVFCMRDIFMHAMEAIQRPNQRNSIAYKQRVMMALFVLLPRARHLHGQALALVTTAPSLLRQVRSRQCLTIASSLQQKHLQFDPKDRIQSPQKLEDKDKEIDDEKVEK